MCGLGTSTGPTVPPERVLDGATTGPGPRAGPGGLAAEAVGGARWCLDTAAEHARTREQFGRPIGQFQGVKHRLADMLVAVEQAVAATWDAALVLGAEPRAGARGGDRPGRAWPSSWPGPWPSTATWRRPRGPSRSSGAWASPGSTTPTSTCAGRPRCASWSAAPRPLRAEAARLALAGWRRRLAIELPPEAEALRAELGALSWPGSPRVEDPAERQPGAGRRTGCWPPTGRPRGAATPGPWSSW